MVRGFHGRRPRVLHCRLEKIRGKVDGNHGINQEVEEGPRWYSWANKEVKADENVQQRRRNQVDCRKGDS